MIGAAGAWYLYSSYQSEQEKKKQKIKGKKPRPSPKKEGTTVKSSTASKTSSSSGSTTAASVASKGAEDALSKMSEKEKIIMLLQKLLQTAMKIVSNFPAMRAQLAKRAPSSAQSNEQIMAVLAMQYEQGLHQARLRVCFAFFLDTSKRLLCLYVKELNTVDERGLIFHSVLPLWLGTSIIFILGSNA